MAMPVSVRVRDELRLAGTLLAAGEWPAYEQSQKPYKPHRAAEEARRYFAPHRAHPAVLAAGGLAVNASGSGPHHLFAAAAAGAWPRGVAEHLADFTEVAQPQVFWATIQPAWSLAEDDLCAVLGRADLAGFLDALFGQLAQRLEVFPNLLYPGRQPVAFTTPGAVVVSQPPPPAWGASPPWRYSERPDEVLAVLAQAAAEVLFERQLPAAHARLRPHAPVFALAAAVVFLRQTDDPAAGDQLLVMEKKARRLPHLPGVVAALAAALAARPGALADYVTGLGLDGPPA